ncbi:polysaccharide biosynthesis protein [Pseudoxanthomonas winnipegensis]|uniref:polysaccharide biosynthesis protein n=1 Tax=Pseudoxanthomonas winnipegensis TaxID=2480810 RepID=UPI0025784605|nr:nucleoside-diphosphate sugar epimerase/dehydratase [Pseudoxanthomonas winnipegensis]WJI17380.1 polysaccharide biosynthesis protein [Pseudoxanthomonas winnipegensis]
MKNWRSRLSVTVPRVAIVCHDLLMVWLCWHGLHWLRYAMVPGAPPLPWWSTESAIVLIAQGIVFWRVGLYRGLWRFASVPDLANIFKAGLIGLLVIAICLVIYNRIDAVSRAALLLYPFGLVGLLGLPRLLYRAWKDHQIADAVDVRAKRVLILGAGRAAEALLRDLRRSGAWEPVGLLDDDEKLQGTKLRGVPVLGKLDDAANIARETAARLVVIAMPSLDASQMQRVVGICENAGLPFRTVPRLVDILEGRSMPGELKEVAIDDLLGRKPVTPDWKLIRGWLGGRTVLVTGAGGSIGSELCRQCARHGAARIALMEISEWALIRSHQALTKAFPDLEVIPFLGNCGDPAAIRRALAIVQPDAVFHAAAYKHVPLLEGQLREAIRNNVLVTETMARACREAKVGTFVFISTDKAVDPANVLGASKRLAEMTCQSLDERGGGTRFTTVRFGNVLDSAGSVVPLFREQIRTGGPVTVTHPDVTRYFMTIPEACQLIVQAAASAAHASIYTLDMGEPIPIRILAEQMIRLAGKQPGRDIAITYTGLRPGEKLHETLFHAEELYRPTAHSKILEARARDVSLEAVTRALQQLRQAVADYDDETMRRVLHAAIPEFIPAPEHEAMNTVVQFPTREARNHR